MAVLLGAQRLGALAGSRMLFSEVTLALADGDAIGLLGPNGAGKSTLMRLLARRAKSDEGSVTFSDGVKVSYLSQNDELDPTKNVREAIHGQSPEHLWATDAKIRDIHAGLLFDISLDTLVSNLSGGQRRRVALAKCLVQEAQVIMLDEPTNHLDVQGVAWLASHLNARFNLKASKASGALVVITHDRWFLDAICTNIWEVVSSVDPGGDRPQIPGSLEFYEGGYAAYVLARLERERQKQVAAVKRNNLLRKELAWLRRGAPARTSKPKFRIDVAQSLIENVPPPRDEVELVKMASARLGKRVIELEDVSFSYQTSGQDTPEVGVGSGPGVGGKKKILDAVTWRLAPGARIGVLGANGAGKTTLLSLLSGDLKPDEGRVLRGKTVELAVLTQSTSELDKVGHLRVVEALAAIKEIVTIGGKEVTASQMAQRLGFTRERAWTPVSELSGGERRRLQLMRLLMSEPNVLFLDEPTNDLDTDTLSAMEDLLDTFAGTLVVVSHDRYFLERVSDIQVAVTREGKVRDLPGGVEEFLENQADLAGKKTGDETKNLATQTSATNSQTRRVAKRESERLERVVKKLEAQIEKINEEMAKVALEATDFQALAELGKNLATAREQLQKMESEWLEALDLLESLEEN